MSEEKRDHLEYWDSVLDRYAEQGDPHLQSMCSPMKRFLREGRIGKFFRWLGFVQGVLWERGVYTIEEFKEDNRNRCAVLEDSTPASGEGEPDVKAIVEALGFDPTNHHNAALCPYCNPGEARPQSASGEDKWLPTSENINALPEGLRDWIHDLETRADPAEDVRARIMAEETIRHLLARPQPTGEPDDIPDKRFDPSPDLGNLIEAVREVLHYDHCDHSPPDPESCTHCRLAHMVGFYGDVAAKGYEARKKRRATPTPDLEGVLEELLTRAAFLEKESGDARLRNMSLEHAFDAGRAAGLRGAVEKVRAHLRGEKDG